MISVKKLRVKTVDFKLPVPNEALDPRGRRLGKIPERPVPCLPLLSAFPKRDLVVRVRPRIEKRRSLLPPIPRTQTSENSAGMTELPAINIQGFQMQLQPRPRRKSVIRRF